mmetsp:Transcript_3492/g.10936  ORF Transcript_3492/g.10936 Transcript_3492/m.10936 type:complete len:244 (-) Transcript_3492:776-1507(-)
MLPLPDRARPVWLRRAAGRARGAHRRGAAAAAEAVPERVPGRVRRRAGRAPRPLPRPALARAQLVRHQRRGACLAGSYRNLAHGAGPVGVRDADGQGRGRADAPVPAPSLHPPRGLPRGVRVGAGDRLAQAPGADPQWCHPRLGCWGWSCGSRLHRPAAHRSPPVPLYFRRGTRYPGHPLPLAHLHRRRALRRADRPRRLPAGRRMPVPDRTPPGGTHGSDRCLTQGAGAALPAADRPQPVGV